MNDEPDAKKYVKLREIDDLIVFNRGGTVDHNKGTHSMKKCYFLSDQIAITYKGNVVCSNDFHSKEIYGNVNSNHLVHEIWNGAAFTTRRKRLRLGKFDAEVCKLCSGNN